MTLDLNKVEARAYVGEHIPKRSKFKKIRRSASVMTAEREEENQTVGMRVSRLRRLR